jgi:hypothetical protein
MLTHDFLETIPLARFYDQDLLDSEVDRLQKIIDQGAVKAMPDHANNRDAWQIAANKNNQFKSASEAIARAKHFAETAAILDRAHQALSASRAADAFIQEQRERLETELTENDLKLGALKNLAETAKATWLEAVATERRSSSKEAPSIRKKLEQSELDFEAQAVVCNAIRADLDSLPKSTAREADDSNRLVLQSFVQACRWCSSVAIAKLIGARLLCEPANVWAEDIVKTHDFHPLVAQFRQGSRA